MTDDRCLGWYVTQPWVDVPVHATTPGATTAAVYLLLARADLAADLPAVTGLGLALWSAAGWGTVRVPVRRG